MLIQLLKLAYGCKDCGYRDHPTALEFDHLPGFEKEFNISQGIGRYDAAALFAEIAKCEVVCACCHRIRTHERRQANAK